MGPVSAKGIRLNVKEQKGEPRWEPRKSHSAWDSRVLPALLRRREEFPAALLHDSLRFRRWWRAAHCTGAVMLREAQRAPAVKPGKQGNRVPDSSPSSAGSESIAVSESTCPNVAIRRV